MYLEVHSVQAPDSAVPDNMITIGNLITTVVECRTHISDNMPSSAPCVDNKLSN